jgi:hypothetical protein|tara:strand:- start:6906 stop:7520 length:615 start_codon:yes stop_codon:yes gene_type:complete
METAAEVWTRFKPKLAEAREKDRAQVALSFLPIIVPLGRFEIAPLTIERLLWLEQINSPFVSGEVEPTKEDVLAFLWINSPCFRVGESAGKRFCWNNCLIDWKKYANLITEYMVAIGENMGSAEEGGVQPNWLPDLIDAFASQYHWTSDAIMDMPIERACILSKAMVNRTSEGKNSSSFSPNADQVRANMIAAIAEAERKNHGG